METILHLAQEGLVLVLLLSAPPVVACLLAGLLTSVFQATTQLQDASLTAVPRLLAVYGSLAITAPWIGGQLVRFAEVVFDAIAWVG